MKPHRYGRDASLMQIAAAVVGSSAAAQVIRSEQDQQAEQHTYLTGGTPGVSETTHRLDVVGANQRRLIVFRSPEGIWIGGCLVSSREDLERLSGWLSGGGNGHA